MMKLTSPYFGILVLGLLFFGGCTILMEKFVRPQDELSKKLSNKAVWTPELKYIHTTRLVLGFLVGMLVTGTICIYVYAR